MMGYEQREIRIVGRVSRHNGPQDDQDDKMWDDMEKLITIIVSNYETSLGVIIV